MHCPCRYRGVLTRAVFTTFVASVMCVAPCAHAQATNHAEQAAAQNKLDAVKAQIAELARQQRETGTRRDNINAQLATQATQLAAAAKALQASDAAIIAGQQRLQALTQRRDSLTQHLHGQRAALA